MYTKKWHDESKNKILFNYYNPQEKAVIHLFKLKDARNFLVKFKFYNKWRQSQEMKCRMHILLKSSKLFVHFEDNVL